MCVIRILHVYVPLFQIMGTFLGAPNVTKRKNRNCTFEKRTHYFFGGGGGVPIIIAQHLFAFARTHTDTAQKAPDMADFLKNPCVQ